MNNVVILYNCAVQLGPAEVLMKALVKLSKTGVLINCTMQKIKVILEPI